VNPADLVYQSNLVGIDEDNRVAMVVGSIPMALSGYKVIRLKGIPRILVSRTVKTRPLVSGISIGHVDITAGTLGWFVEYQNDTHLLSNAHVFTPEPWSSSAPSAREIIQPGRYDGGTLEDTVAYYVKHVPVKLIDVSTCPVSRAWVFIYNKFAEMFGAKTRIYPVVAVAEDNRVDAAIAYPTSAFKKAVLMDNGTTYTPDKVVGLLFAGSEVDDIFIACKAKNIEKELGVKFNEDIYEVGIGDRVVKCGRTTGCTEGEVLSTKMKVKVFYGKGFAIFNDVIVVKGKAGGGDSGSLVFPSTSK